MSPRELSSNYEPYVDMMRTYATLYNKLDSNDTTEDELQKLANVTDNYTDRVTRPTDRLTLTIIRTIPSNVIATRVIQKGDKG
ncbi:unnamed protein product [Arctia plantaginis]|uniref:Uncharacterized protein n=1 Tax=Arctia plantaginis TaxID=874455 RepID=A0A8S1AUM3_ARCPL|nr:unnamed protein product [Arctia plantaginis]CAB3260454.1 unnamed protein product [Arctia plantaginis]